MSKRLEKLSVEELEQALLRKRSEERRRRLQRLKEEGRVVVTDIEPPEPTPLGRAIVSGQLARVAMPVSPSVESENDLEESGTGRSIAWRWVFNRFLLLVEIGAAVGFIAIIFSLFGSVRTLNQDAAQAQTANVVEVAAVAATPTEPPVIDLIVLPGGHQPPVEGRPIVYTEAGDIPEHLLPLIDAYTPPPVPTPSAIQPRQILIPEIEVNAPVVQGHEPEQLKKGVGHAIGSALPGASGNMVLSAHNDIYGEIFRHLDKLTAGDEVVVSNGSEEYTYIINEIQVVEPTAVEVMAPTDHASLTLISCYPYLINNKRIVVSADLVEESTLGIGN